MGAVEEGGKVAVEVTKALGSNPVLLSMTIIIGVVLWFGREDRRELTAQRDKVTSQYIAQQDKFNELLSKCVVPGQKTEAEHAAPTAFPFPD